MSLFRKQDLQTFDEIVKTASKKRLMESTDSSLEAKFDIFLSHSYDDSELIGRLYEILLEMGFTVYVDWIVDKSKSRLSVTPETARWIRNRMRHCETMLYATSDTSGASKWMPWELGLFDGINGKVAILPITSGAASSDDYQGQEFLGLYPYISKGVAIGDTKESIWVHKKPTEYVNYRGWMSGTQPFVRT